MHIITITTYPSMPGRYRVDCDPGAGKRKIGRDVSNAGEAAAVALNYAASAAEYIVVGHDEAVNQIPAALRIKRQ